MNYCTPNINIAPYMSKFVRSLHAEEDRTLEMPFNYTQFGAVLMVDIVGFSQMTSIASSKGDVGAEMLSSQIGLYFDLAIRIIEFHGGDVVKFLGDALLVVFQADPVSDPLAPGIDSSSSDDSAAALRRNKVSVRKAVECGLELLARLSNYRIYLSERDFSRKTGVGNSFNTSNLTNNGPFNPNNSNNTGSSNLNGGSLDDPLTSGHVNGNSSDDGNNASGMNSNQNGNRNGAWNSLIPGGTADNPTGMGTLTGNNYNSGTSNYASSFLGVPSNRVNTSNSGNNGGSSVNLNNNGASNGFGGGGGYVYQNSGNNNGGQGPRRSSVPNNSVSPVTMPPKFASGNNLDMIANGSLGVGGNNSNNTGGGGGNNGYRKREESVISTTSYSRPPSTTSRHNRAGSFFANAKNLFTHSSSSADRQSVSTEDYSEDSHELQLHMALSAGPISNIIIGDIGGDNGLDNLLLRTTGRLEYAICGEQMATIDDALNMARAGELTITASAWKHVNPDAYPWFEPRRHCFILKNIQSVNDDPLLRKIRNDKLLNTSVESNPHYYKYINKSAIHRLILYPDNTFPAQFRTVTILFVSLGDVKPWTPEGLDTCQKAFFQVHKVTSEYEGFIQQFAVDDKGATLLCAFGLPYPRSHEREAVFAAKSAWMIRRRLLSAGILGFKISLATGVIFTSMIGNEFRRDPGIVGDTIVIAVRILKFDYATESVVCDDATKVACTSDHDGLCEFEDMGEEFVKGKIHPIRVWRLIHFGAKKQIRRPDDIMVDETIGYEPEREKVIQFIKSWHSAPKKNTILVTGPRGSGKSMFYQQICHIADRENYHVCSAASAEVEKNTEYYLCKFLLLGLFDIMRKRDIPYANGAADTAKKDPKTATATTEETPATPTAANPGLASTRPPVTDLGIHFGNRPQPLQLQQLQYEHQQQENRQAPPPLSAGSMAPSVAFSMAPSTTASTIATAMSSSWTDNTLNDAAPNTPTFFSDANASPTTPAFPTGPGNRFGPSVRSSLISNATSVASGTTATNRASGGSGNWDMSLSPTMSQFGEPSKRSSTYITKLQALINVSLQKMGEGDGMMHILHDIIAALSSDNSAPIMNARDDEMLADFIVRMLNYASAFVRIIVMFEDIQWCDQKSMTIIQVIHDRCPKVLVVVFSRPQRDYGGGNLLHKITAHFKHLEISLDGLKRREIELALLKTFEDNGVSRISPEVIELVQEKTKGNPKFVKNMALMLKDFCHVNIVDGELMTTGSQSIQSPSYKNMEEMLVKQDRKKMILMQYDRMTPKFQDFLKIASCLGEQFSLAEVGAIRPLESMLGTPEPGRSFPTMISDLDTFRFLSMTTDQQTNVQFSENVVENTLYTFGSGSTARDIYESIPYEERVSYHLMMGQFYESFLEPAQFSDLLPQITRHYLKTDHTEKKIKYLKALSAFDLKSNMLTDATKSLTQLIQILDTERGAINMVSQEDLADIYGMNGESLSKRMRIEEAEPALFASLARYGVQWPRTPQQWRMTLFLEKTKFVFHYHGGTTPGLNLPGKAVPKAKVDAKSQVTLQRIIRVLGCLQNIYFWKTDTNAAMLSTLLTLNYSRRLGLPSGEQTVSLGRYGLLNYFKGNKHTCMEYLQKAKLANDAGEATEGMLPSMRAYVEYCEGRREEAHQLLSDAINESKSFGVVSNLATFYRSVTLKCAYRMWEGSFNVHPEDSALLRAMSAVAIQNGDSEGETLFAIPTLANLLLQDRLRDAESWVVLIERFIMPQARLMNLLVIHGMLSYYYAKMGNFFKTRIYAEILAERIGFQCVAAHPFPLMACAFTVMAMYEMLDSAHVNGGAYGMTGGSLGGASMNGVLGGLGPGGGNLNLNNTSAHLSNSNSSGNLSSLHTPTSSSSNTSGHHSSTAESISTGGGGGASSSSCPVAKTEQILKPILNCLSQDPFHAVAHSFLVLAEALRCFILQGRHNHEGYLKLHRGFERLQGQLEGINFVKGYFLTKLGKHAESGRERDYFYCEAYLVFVSMGMDPCCWLTDPSPGWQHPPVNAPEFNPGTIPTPS